jgi:hypothetical protein
MGQNASTFSTDSGFMRSRVCARSCARSSSTRVVILSWKASWHRWNSSASSIGNRLLTINRWPEYSLKLLVCDFRHTLTKVSTQPGCLWMATTIVVSSREETIYYLLSPCDLMRLAFLALTRCSNCAGVLFLWFNNCSLAVAQRTLPGS